MVGGAAAARPARRDRTGTWFADERGVERRMKVSWHPERKLFVLSLWHGDTCAATFRLPLGEVPRLVRTFVDVLGQAAGSGGESAGERSGGGRQPVGAQARDWSQTWPEAWRRRRPRRRRGD